MTLLLFTISAAHAAWTYPDHPDPTKIFQQAQTDATAGRYEDALAKQTWFHQNILKYQLSQYGIRLSFASNVWAKFGESYPLALET